MSTDVEIGDVCLLPIKKEALEYEFDNHELSGDLFILNGSQCIAIQESENGMMLCISSNGEYLRVPENSIRENSN